MSQEIEATKMVPSASRRSLTSTDNMVLVEIDHSFRQLLLRELGGKTLDNLYILPCGHKAMEQGIQIRVLHLASQGRRQLSLNCYIVEGVTVKDDGNLVFHMKQASETQTFCGTDSTNYNLVRCRVPKGPCHSKVALTKWK